MKIFVFNSDEYQDYLSDLINCYLFSTSLDITTNYLPPFLFDDFLDKESLYGKGFTVYGKLDSSIKNNISTVNESEILNIINNSEFDLIIFTSIRRTFAGSSIVEKYLKEIGKYVDSKKIITVDGEDDNTVLNNVSSNFRYYKRELISKNTNTAYPISFSFPEHFDNFKITDIKKKLNILAPMDPRFSNSYIFDEENYYKQYANSIFGTTTKKGGWDCLRHYEIIAAGCLPYFPGIEKKPSTIMTNYPVELQIRINDIFENIILSGENIDSVERLTSSSHSRPVKKIMKKMSKMNVLENNLDDLQNLNDELQVWYQSNGKSNIYKFLLNTKDY